MKKYEITISYICEAEHEIGAAFALHRSLYPLGDNELEKFNAIKVEEITND